MHHKSFHNKHLPNTFTFTKKQCKKCQIYAGGTLFHIYISILKSYKDRLKGEKSVLIISDHIEGISEICKSIRELNYFEDVYEIPFHSLGNKFKKETCFIKKTFIRNRAIISFFDKKTHVDKIIAKYHTAEINLFYCQSIISAYFVLKYPNFKQRLLEDGERNYINRIGIIKLFKRKYVLKTFVGEGMDKCIREIHVQKPERLTKKLEKKGVKLNTEKLLSIIPENDKKQIISLFLPEGIQLQKYTKPKLLVITQPLSEEGLIDENYKILLYKKIIKEYRNDYQIFFKTHPRERTDYASKIENINMIPKLFPLEILNLIPDINFDIGITLYSSALNNVSCIVNKVFLGMDYDKKISLRKSL